MRFFGQLECQNADSELQIVPVEKNAFLHSSPVDFRPVRAVQISQDEVQAVVSDSRMVARYLAVIQPHMAADASTDDDVLTGSDFEPAASIGTIDGKE